MQPCSSSEQEEGMLSAPGEKCLDGQGLTGKETQSVTDHGAWYPKGEHWVSRLSIQPKPGVQGTGSRFPPELGIGSLLSGF